MPRARPRLLLVPLVLASVAISGCPNFPVSTEICSVTPCQGDASADASSIDVPPGCDLTKDPKDSPACVDDSVSIFVSPDGDDGALGSKTAPLRTIARAIEKVSNKPRIYICAGSYAEVIQLASPVSVYGGLACGSWTYTGEHPRILAGAGRIPLSIMNVDGARVVDVDFEAADASTKGGSSIAGLFVSSTVVLRRTSFFAGAGQSSEDNPASAEPFDPVVAIGGNDGTSSTNGGQQINSKCAESIGAPGGPPVSGGTKGFDGVPKITPAVPATATGLGGTGTDCGAGGTGKTGSHGAAGRGGEGAMVLGALNPNGWSPQPGQAGGPGGVGQGGGGGASADTSGGGGGGGAGGCGGRLGSGGAGGGASIAIASLNSDIRIESSSLRAVAGGRGANGGVGQVGQMGGGGGGVAGGSNACVGGRGGAGGGGGGGGGGAGGISVGILWRAKQPFIDGQFVKDEMSVAGIVAGAAGKGGTGGKGGPAAAAPGALEGTSGTEGIPGKAQAVLGI